MKKTLSILLAAATLLAACTKSEVTLDHENEIGFAPASKNITKAAMEAGDLPSSQFLGIWAYWNGVSGTVEDNATYTEYTDPYLNDAEFANRTNTKNWGGNGVAYPWPANGALVFVGYNKPSTNGVAATYSGLTTDQITFTNYTQSADPASTFDLAWFSKTEKSYNERTSGDAVDVTLSHALSWITIKVYGEGTTITDNAQWKIKKITLNDIANTGTGVCSGSGAGKATWSSTEYNTDMVIYNCSIDNTNNGSYKENGRPLTGSALEIENTSKGTVVIPQTINPNNQTAENRTNHTLTIEYTYPVAGTYKDGVTTVNLDLTSSTDNTLENKWLSGTHYIYTLLFKANEILVAPSYGAWEGPVNQTITVE